MPSLDRSVIRRLPAFGGLSREESDEILKDARSARFAKGLEIFSQDEEARSFHLLLSGHIRVVRTSPEGSQVIARYINEGELFGMAMAMGRMAYPASAVAAVDCVVLTWPNSVCRVAGPGACIRGGWLPDHRHKASGNPGTGLGDDE